MYHIIAESGAVIASHRSAKTAIKHRANLEAQGKGKVKFSISTAPLCR